MEIQEAIICVCQKYAKMTISGVLQATPELLDYMNARTLKVVQSLMADGLASHEGNNRTEHYQAQRKA